MLCNRAVLCELLLLTVFFVCTGITQCATQHAVAQLVEGDFARSYSHDRSINEINSINGLQTDVVGWWRGGAMNCADSGTKSNNLGTCTVSMSTSGPAGKGLAASGNMQASNAQKRACGTLTSQLPTGDYSLSFWIYGSGSDSTHIFGFGSGNVRTGVYITRASSTNRIGVYNYASSACYSNDPCVQASYSLLGSGSNYLAFPDNAWSHILITWTASSRTFRGYLNGGSAYSFTTQTTYPFTTSSSGTLCIGNRPSMDDDTQLLKPIASVLLLSRVVTANELTILATGNIFCNGISSASSSVCSGRGTCSSPDKCINCAAGYSGVDCEIWSCNGISKDDANVCSGRGTCQSLNVCQCNTGYLSNTYCSTWQCYGKNNIGAGACSNNGTCTSPNYCSCNSNFDGNECQNWYCYTILYSAATVCSNRNGSCTATNNCFCKPGFTGSRCESWSCNGVAYTNPMSCSNHGQCVAPSQCACDPNYSGSSCSTTTCFGVSSNALSACSSQGTCSGYNTCSCNNCYAGDRCQYFVCQTSSLSMMPSTQLQLFYYDGTNNNMTIRTSNSYPAEVGSNIYCTLTFGGTTKLVPTQNISTTDYRCSFPSSSSTNIGTYYIGLAFSRDGTTISSTLSSNQVPIVFVKYGSLSKRIDNYYDIIVTGAQSWKIAVNTNSLLVAADVANGIQCVRYNDGSSLTVIQLSSTSFECTTTESTTRTIQIALRLIFGSGFIYVTGPINYDMLAPGPIAFTSGAVNGQMTDTQFVPTFSLQSSGLTATYISRFYCAINADLTSAVIAANTKLGISPEFNCSLRHSIVGVQQLNVYLAPPLGSTAAKYKFSSNSLPLVIAAPVIVSLATFVPTKKQQVVQPTVLTNSYANIGDYYGGNVTYGCNVNGVNFFGVLNAATSKISCNVSQTTQNIVALSVYLNTTATNTIISWGSGGLVAFYDQSAATTLSPFIVSHDTSVTTSTQSVTVGVTLPVISTLCSYIFGVYNNGMTNVQVPVTCNAGNTFTFTVSRSSFNSSGVTLQPIQLVYGYNGDYSFTILTTEVYLTYIRTPIDFVAAPSILQPSTLGTYSLSFPVPDAKANLGYSVAYYQDLSNLGQLRGWIGLSCNFSLTYPQCTIPNFVPEYIPIKLQFGVFFGRSGQPFDYPLVMMSPRIYKQPFNVLTTMPYFADTTNAASTAQTFTFRVDASLHPLYTFQAQKTLAGAPNETVSITSDPNDRSLFSAPFKSFGVDGTSSVDIYLTTLSASESSGVASVSALAGRITNISVPIEFATLQVTPPLFSGPDTSSSYSLTYKGTSSSYKVPALYRNTAVSIFLQNYGSMYFTGTVNPTNGTVSFTKSLQVTKLVGTGVTQDIQLLSFAYAAGTTQVALNASVVLYQPQAITTKYPLGVLRGTNTTVTFKFAQSTLLTSLPISYQFYTQTNYSLSNKEGYVCTPAGSNYDTISCSVTNATTQLVSNSYVPLLPYLKVPSMNISDVLLTTTSFDDDKLKLYYIDQAPITLNPSTQPQFLLTARTNTIQLLFNGTLPNISNMRNKYVYCSYAFLTGTPLYALAILDSITSSGFNYNCTYAVPYATVGRVNVSLYYSEAVDSSTTSFDFQLSSNTIEFTYSDTVNLQTIIPLATRTNQSIPTVANIQSQFIGTADYGISLFYAAVSVVNSTVTYSLPATLQIADGSFIVLLSSSVNYTISIDIVMNTRGVNRTISNAPVSFSFVDGNFLSPSYGTLAGGATVFMNPYEGPPTDQTITVDVDNTITFPCKYWSVGPQLNCTTPAINNKLAPFQSVFATVAGKQLSIKYVLIDYRTISLGTTVFLAGTTININVTLDAVLSMTLEGAAIVQLSSSTLSGAIRENIGTLTSVKNIVRTYDTTANGITAGAYSVTLMYYNTNLFEARSMIAFTNSVPVTFIASASLSYQTNSASAVFLNTPTNVTVVLAGGVLSSTIRTSLTCKFDSSFVTVTSTYDMGSNTITCTVLATQPTVSLLSLWYVNANAPSGGFKVSSATLTLVAMQMLTLTPIPRATLGTTQTVTFNTTITTDASVFAPYLTYSCLYYDPANPNPSGSFLNNKIVPALRIAGTNQFNCSVTVSITDSKFYQVLLYATSLATNQFVSISSGPASVYFMKQVQLYYVTPFFKTIVSSTDVVRITLKTQASESLYTESIITDRLLYCKYSTVDKNTWLYSPATLLTSTTVYCDITVVHMSQTDVVDVTLWYNAGGSSLTDGIINKAGYSFNLAPNNVSITFVQQPLYFTGKVPFTGVVFRPDVLNQTMTLNLRIPAQTLPQTYQVRMNTTGLNETTPSCTYTNGSLAACVLVNDAIIIPRTPALMNLTITITNPASGEVVILPIQTLTYVESINIMKAYPYALSYSEYSSTGATVQYEIDHAMNTQYSYQCFVYSVTKPSYVVPAIFSTTKTFSCKLKSNNQPESLQVSLQYQQPTNYYTSSYIVPLSSNATISFITPLRLTLPIASLPTTGSFVVSTMDPLPTPPTQYYNHSSYMVSIVLNDRTKPVSMSNCTIRDNVYVSCILPTSVTSYPSYPWYTNMDLYVLNGTYKSHTLSPKFVFVQVPVFKSISPVMFIRTSTVTPTTYVTVEGSNLFASSDYAVSIVYSCTTCYSVISGTPVQNGTCTFISTSQLSCPAPQYDYNAGQNSGVLSVSFVMGGSTYLSTLAPTVYDSNSITITSATNTDCSPYYSQTVTVKGTNFVNGSIWLRYTDFSLYSVTTRASVQFIDANTIQLQSPVLWSVNLVYPRLVHVLLSFDNGVNFVRSPQPLSYATLRSVDFTPTSFVAGQAIANVSFTNFPSLIQMNANRMLTLELYESTSGTVIPVICSSTYTNCSTIVALPAASTLLEFRVFAVNKTNNIESTRVYIPFTNSLVVFQYATVASVFPSRLFLTMTQSLTFNGQFASLLGLFSKVSLMQNTATMALTIDSLTNTSMTISGLSASTISILQPSSRKVQAANTVDVIILPAGGSTYDLLASTDASKGVPVLTILPSYRIDTTYNLDFENEEGTAFSFQDTHIRVSGANFPTLTSAQVSDSVLVKFSNPLFEDRTFSPETVSLTMIDSNTLTMTIPQLSNITSTNQTSLRFPLSVDIQISFNWGVDYASVPISVVNQFKQPILTNLNPAISPRREVDMLIQGKYLSSATVCTFSTIVLPDYTTPVTRVMNGNSTSDYAVRCTIPKFIAENAFITLVNVYVSTSYDETSSPLVFSYHEVLNISDTTPTSGSTVGGTSVLLTTTGIVSGYPLYVRFSELVSAVPCTIYKYQFDDALTQSIVNCTVVSHTNGKARIMLSYDQTNWFMVGGSIYSDTLPSTGSDPTFNYNYLPCDAGYSAPDFSATCQACPAGTYKPSAGIYSCIPCANGTFNALEAQFNCSICPLHTSSAPNSTQFLDCVCNPGYYRNPEPRIPLMDTCLSCPKGGICTAYNTTIPPAQPGYWHAAAKPYQYYLCFPEAACPGGGVNNCSVGYNKISDVCGLCDIGYYKWRNACTECSPDAWYKLLLALIALGVITVAFFAISSAKVSHLASLSIAFSFWQIVAMFASFDIAWPSVVSGSFTAASIANLNIDFLSPQCIFPTMNHVDKWIVITMLPFYFLGAFVLLYILGEIRALIVNRTGKFIRIKYMAFREEHIQEDEDDKKKTTKQEVIQTIKNIANTLLTLSINLLIWCRNFCVWSIKEGATRKQMSNYRNKIINSYTAFISFTYIFIMGQASQIFVCTNQADGKATLNASPDIVCFVSYGDWPKMLPLTIILYVIFGLGSILFFIALYLYSRYLQKKSIEVAKQIRLRKMELDMMKPAKEGIDEEEPDELTEDQDELLLTLEKQEHIVSERIKAFNMRFKFMLARFKRKYFYWEAVVTGRKLLISILNTFLKPMLVVVLAILVIIIALLLHMFAVPFRYKFHNVMEYVVLLSILIVLFLGLLFFVDQFPTAGTQQFCIWLATIVIICSTVVVVAMIVWDFFTRRKKDIKLVKARRQQLIEKFGALKKKELEKEYRKLFPSAFSTRSKQVEKDEDEDWQEDPEWIFSTNLLLDGIDWTVKSNPLLEDPTANVEEDYAGLMEVSNVVQFQLPFYASEPSMSEEGTTQTLNDIMDDLFGITRLRKKLSKAKDVGNKIRSKLKK